MAPRWGAVIVGHTVLGQRGAAVGPSPRTAARRRNRATRPASTVSLATRWRYGVGSAVRSMWGATTGNRKEEGAVRMGRRRLAVPDKGFQ